MLEEYLPVCGICKRPITSDADVLSKTARFCKLCGMSIEGSARFCCNKCEGIFKRYIKTKKEKVKQ